MRFKIIVSTLLFLNIFIISGCTPPKYSDQRMVSKVDISEISKKISREDAKSALLDVSETVEKEPPGPKIKDLSVETFDRNPYLDNVSVPKKRKLPKAVEGEGILLNFDNADIYEVIQVIAETLGLNYIIDPQVKGIVNIRSGQKIPMNQLSVLFRKILNINGLDIRQEGEYEYIFVSNKLASQNFFGPGQMGDLKKSPRMVIQVLPLMYMSSTEAMQLIEPYISEQGSVHNLTSSNTLIITDFESKVIDSLMLLSRIDISPLSSLKVRLVKIENAPLFDLRDELLEILSALQINKKDRDAISVIPLERVNSILLVSNNRKLIESAEEWVSELDVVPTQGRDNIYIYNVRNSVASDLADLVNTLISDQGDGKTSQTRRPAPIRPASATEDSTTRAAAPSTASRGVSSGETSSSLHFAGEPVLIADDSRNIILLRALPVDYSRLAKLLERLDNLPRQVLIEVLVAEVTLSDGWEFGIEWALKDNNLNINHHDYTQTYSTEFDQVAAGALGGFSYSAISNSGRLITVLNALADKDDVSILSSPQVLVLNNETATVNVGQEVPIVTTETINDDVNTNNTRTVQYRDTGIILNVTPRINYDGIIILDIDQQVSEALTENVTSGIDSPVITSRELKTKLAVKDGQSILMGGLIERKTESGEVGVPLLKDIPVLGWLFKYQTETNDKTELVIMITPYVIESEDVLDQYISQFKLKMDELRGELTGAESQIMTQ